MLRISFYVEKSSDSQCVVNHVILSNLWKVYTHNIQEKSYVHVKKKRFKFDFYYESGINSAYLYTNTDSKVSRSTCIITRENEQYLARSSEISLLPLIDVRWPSLCYISKTSIMQISESFAAYNYARSSLIDR